jgi:hypothetical protein
MVGLRPTLLPTLEAGEPTLLAAPASSARSTPAKVSAV